MKAEVFFKKLINAENLSPAESLLLFLLKQISHLYSLVMSVRAFCYGTGMLKTFSLPRPVISVGNLVLGGTGKTPVTLWIARYLMAKKMTVAVLTRGYGGNLEGKVAVVSDGKKRLLTAQDAGDEPALLADLLPGLIVIIGSNRYDAGCLAMERFNPDIFIVDDGFQHLRLRRDLNLLLLDAMKPLGNGHVFPAGTLRESPASAKRADLAIFTRSRIGSNPESAFLSGVPFAQAFHELSGFTDTESPAVRPFSDLSHLKGLAFAGIADPDGFFTALEGAGLKLSATLSFPDHTAYGEEETAALATLYKSSGADYLITTAKDAVKIGAGSGRRIPFYTAELDITFSDQSIITKALDKFV